MKLSKEETYKGVMDFLFAIFGKALLPIILPILIYKIYIGRKRRAGLEGKVVLITGASSGLGESLAEVFYTRGCKVILASRRVEELSRVKSRLLSIKTESTFEPEILPLDLLDVDSMSMKAAEAEARFGQVDVVVHNGGVSYRGDILNTSMDVHINVMTVNYFGPVALTRALLSKMIERGGGHVVGITSVQGQIALPFRSAYSSSKHAFLAYLDCLRSEVAQKNINVSVISPGYIKTNLSKNALTGSGSQYGVTDATTAGGYEPSFVAEKVYEAVLNKNEELIVSPLSPKLAIILRVVIPKLYFYIMKKRAKSNQN